MGIYDIVVVGAGQAGIAMGYYLKQEKLSFILLDHHTRIGDAWRKRYDSLVLFTPRKYSSLPGMIMQGAPNTFPTKDDMADYLVDYVKHFNIPVKLGIFVTAVSKQNHHFVIQTNQGIVKAKQVVIASGAFQKPFIPSIITGHNDSILHMHSSEYRSPKELPSGPVTVVGGGNSGVQIAVELSKERDVSLAVSHSLKFLPLRLLGKSMFWWLDKIGLLYAGMDTKKGLWFQKRKDPIFGYELKRLIGQEKIIIKQKVVKVEGNKLFFQDGSQQTSRTIIWATGFKPAYDWLQIDDAIFEDGKPIHNRGVSMVEGLYYIGQPWQYQRGSALICGVGRDAAYLIPFILD